MRKLCSTVLLLTLLMGIPGRLWGAPIRVSFLDQGAALEQTVETLRARGCTEDAIDAFSRAVRHYYRVPLHVDTSTFPLSTDGFFTFDSGARLVSALPHRLYQTSHPFEINCFDTALLLAADGLSTNMAPDSLERPFLATYADEHERLRLQLVASPRDAVAVMYPDWYTNTVRQITGTSRTDSQVCLTACFNAYHPLPLAAQEQNLKEVLMDALRSQWAGDGLSFGEQISIVLLHNVSLEKHFFITTHIGLLLPHEDGYVYLEKAGGSGPFFRIDISDLSDLADYYAFFSSEEMQRTYPRSFMTINDRSIYELTPSRTVSSRVSP